MEPKSSAAWAQARSFIAGSFSGAALVLAGHPFDTIVVRISSGQVRERAGGEASAVP